MPTTNSQIRCARGAGLLVLAVMALTTTLPIGPGHATETPARISRLADPCPASAGLKTGPGTNAYITVTPSEHFNSQRTHLFKHACAPSEMNADAGKPPQVRTAPGDYPSPYNLVTRGRDELFVYGGAYGDQPNSRGSYVARLNPATLQPVWRTQLIDARAEGLWNYPGVIATHRNGSIYAIFGDQIARLNPTTGKVVKQTRLPAPPGSEARDISYNGFTMLDSGVLVAKSIGRGRCDLEGFSALLQCDQSKFPSSVLVAINPDTLEVLSSLVLPEPAFGRITSTTYKGRVLIYLTGPINLVRYEWIGGKLRPDETWGPIAYLLPGQTSAPAVAVVGDYIALQTNSVPAATPMSVLAVSQSDPSKRYSVQPFKDSRAPRSFLPSMITVDPDNMRLFAQDAGAGQLAALDLSPEGLKVRWRVDQRSLSFTTLVGSTRERAIIGTHIPDITSPTQFRTFQNEQVVWRDATTGKELARSDNLQPMTSGALVTPGFGGVVYYPILKGGLKELSFERATP